MAETMTPKQKRERGEMAPHYAAIQQNPTATMEDVFAAGWDAAEAEKEYERVGAMTIELRRVIKERDELQKEMEFKVQEKNDKLFSSWVTAEKERDEALAQLKELKSYMPKVPTQPYEKELAKQLLEARAEVERYIELSKGQGRELTEANSLLTAATAALERYARHDVKCAINISCFISQCDCGWSDALAKIRGRGK